MWPEFLMAAAGAAMVLGGGLRIWWVRRQPLPGPSFDEETWQEAQAALGVDPSEYQGSER